MQEKDQTFEALLDYLRMSRGFDFTGYKRSSLMRRTHKRLAAVGAQTFESYMDYLEVHPEEFSQLFNTILINVTAFFRDKQAWDYLQEQIILRILSSKGHSDPVRVWSAGCASGEEAYTAAMVLAEAMGTEGFSQRVKIYATDIDQEALQEARRAIYTAKQVEGVPEEYLHKYFDEANGSYSFRNELRRALIFGAHDLLQDAPISRLDLLICRNTLMYFNREAQARILARLHFALKDSGYIFLGKAEMLLTHANLFVPVDLRYRIFSKVSKFSLRDRMLIMAQGGEEEADNLLARQIRLREIAFETAPIPQLVISGQGHLLLANEKARVLLQLSDKDMGRMLQDLDLKAPLADRIQALTDKARLNRRPVSEIIPDWTAPIGDSFTLNLEVSLVWENGEGAQNFVVNLVDQTDLYRAQAEASTSRQELETTAEELQSTNEELETTNEELQSTNEELETTNEELQSTNEELETMNEELQSTNEELETTNEEMRIRGRELAQLNSFLKSVLDNVNASIMVLDTSLRVTGWNHESEEMWGLRNEEVKDQNFLGLDFGLAASKLNPVLQKVLSGESEYQEVIMDATNRRGKTFRCRVSASAMKGTDEVLQGVILVMEVWKETTNDKEL